MAYTRAAAIRERPPDDTAPELGWDDLNTYVLGPRGDSPWRQDQHLAAIGPTGQGKTVAVHGLLDAHRKYVAYLSTKIKDRTLDQYLASGGYERVTDWPPVRRKGLRSREVAPDDMPRRLVWPDSRQLDSEEEQKRVFRKALRDIYVDGGWTTVWDDFWYLSVLLGLERDAKKFLYNARSNDIPFVLGAQRPAGNRLVEIFDQADHLLFFRDNDEANLKRIGGVGWLSSDLIRGHVAHLDPHQFLYVNTRNGHMYRSMAPPL